MVRVLVRVLDNSFEDNNIGISMLWWNLISSLLLCNEALLISLVDGNIGWVGAVLILACHLLQGVLYLYFIACVLEVTVVHFSLQCCVFFSTNIYASKH